MICHGGKRASATALMSPSGSTTLTTTFSSPAQAPPHQPNTRRRSMSTQSWWPTLRRGWRKIEGGSPVFFPASGAARDDIARIATLAHHVGDRPEAAFSCFGELRQSSCDGLYCRGNCRRVVALAPFAAPALIMLTK